MFTFKKFSKRLKRTVCGALCCLFLSGLIVVPAMAADETAFEGTILYNGYVNGTYVGNNSLQTPVSGSNQSIPLSQGTFTSVTVAPYSFSINPASRVSGNVAVYISFYYYVDEGSASITSPSLSASNFYMAMTNADGAEYSDTAGTSLGTFSVPVVDGRASSRGYILKYNGYVPDSIIDVSSLRLRFNWSQYNYQITTSNPVRPYLCVPSAKYIVGVSSSDIGALEGIADGIAAQSEILSSMYGDIMELLNDLYSRLGSIQQVQETANAYFAQLIPLVNSINTNTANIYSLLQTQFQLLRTLIATESDDIQAAIDQQTDDLIAYFDTVFSDSVGDMPEKSDDLNTSVGDVSDAETGYQSTATQRFDQLTDTFSGGFSGGTLAGVTLAATLFTRVWNALGDYVIVYTWPLFLGLCLVILGRMSRLSGGQSSSEKHRGDSDA